MGWEGLWKCVLVRRMRRCQCSWVQAVGEGVGRGWASVVGGPESCRWPLGVGAVASMWGHKGGDQSPIIIYAIPWMGQVCGDIHVALQHGQGGWVGLSGGQGPLRRLWYLGGRRCGVVKGIDRWAGTVWNLSENVMLAFDNKCLLSAHLAYGLGGNGGRVG
jgi:hypothetical protein